MSLQLLTVYSQVTVMGKSKPWKPCRLSACIYFARKINLSVITSANRNRPALKDNEVRTFRTFWMRSVQWRKMRGGGLVGFLVSKTRHYFVNFWPVGFHQIWPRHVNPCPIEKYRHSWKFCFAVIAPQKTSKVKGQNGTSLQLRGRTAERYCLLHVMVQGPD